MLPSTSSWTGSYGGSNFAAGNNSLTNFGEKVHRMSTTQPSTATELWAGQRFHRGPAPQETQFAHRRYQQPWGSPSSSSAVSSTSPRAPGTGLAIKDELTDPSDYSSEDTCSDYRGAASSDYRGDDMEDKYRRKAKDRKPDCDETMTVDEIEKRRQRRERNKMAAARCRQRRVDLTNQLLAETETLEDERDRLQREIQALQTERWQLEDVLGSHAARCKGRTAVDGGHVVNAPPIKTGCGHVVNAPPIKTGGVGHVIDAPPIKTERRDGEYHYFNMADDNAGRGPHHPRVPSYGSYAAPAPSSYPPSSCGRRRPDSLPLTGRPAPSSGGGQTPMADLDLHCMLDGHTGLTPITGAPAGPDHQIAVDCGGYSPTTLMTL